MIQEGMKTGSYLIAHRFNMDAVHIHTSTANHTLHHNSPKIHISSISHIAEKGSTASPTNKSATASETMNRFVTVRNLVLMKTARITKQFPTITIRFITASIKRDTITLAFFHSTTSINSSQDLFK